MPDFAVVTGACSGEPGGHCWRELVSMCSQNSGNCQICHSVALPGAQNLLGVVWCEAGSVIWSKERS